VLGLAVFELGLVGPGGYRAAIPGDDAATTRLDVGGQAFDSIQSRLSNDETISFPHPLNGLTTPRVFVDRNVRGWHVDYGVPEVRKELALMGLDATLNSIPTDS
jgi:hypothetical protein